MNTLIVTGGSIDYKFACEYLKKYTWDYVVCADAGMKFCHTAWNTARSDPWRFRFCG